MTNLKIGFVIRLSKEDNLVALFINESIPKLVTAVETACSFGSPKRHPDSCFLKGDALAYYRPKPGQRTFSPEDMRHIREWPLSDIDIEAESRFLPKKGTIEGEILNRRSLSLGFYKVSPPNLSDELKFLNTVINHEKVDLLLMADGDSSERSQGFSLNYATRDGAVRQSFSSLTPTTWKDTGTITSVPDLANTTMIIDWANLEDTHFELECLWLEVSPGRYLDVSGESLKRYSSPAVGAPPIYEFKFPQNLNSLQGSCSDWHP